MALVPTDLKAVLDTLQGVFQRYPRGITVAALASAITVPWLRRNYNQYIEIGPGGLPYNTFGWLIALSLSLFGRETVSTAIYDKDPNKETYLKDPASIPERRGLRPQTGWHVFPQRQLTKFSPKSVRQPLLDIFNKLGKANPGLVEIANSRFEKHHDAIVIASSRPSPHKVADHARREITHIHQEKDFSLHAILAPQDCKLLIERGWAERHPLANSVAPSLGLPKEYLLIYSPRDVEELEMVERIIVAAIGFQTGSREVN
ncbi:hypothetical protein SERLA73DRAFT_181691 [Serpula lacrymans var. lacrymans S7.3]|uniref:Luciferase domain-containing protein n=2 Tax=Serpula lacrymans var. lacrymans TaxID=341189 RepID=F8PYI4_SERL3|nr:uncharacterized protein SERLADRAFT_468008 [Serpula lacrymans var. lacrymans S7.9]EGN98947.1 hypothetical protein SERLA73DRAFT_181691 [Serpula lacrymans var. lacrymans S7.3]EGO24536.1 hypothetical protein SERLADRAFT_468008 [Serpula lacrymans var. lacrymans S7.9]